MYVNGRSIFSVYPYLKFIHLIFRYEIKEMYKGKKFGDANNQEIYFRVEGGGV